MPEIDEEGGGNLVDSFANTIFIHDYISSSTSLIVNKLLYNIANDIVNDVAKSKDDINKLGYSKDLWIQINSSGGDLFGTFSIIDTMNDIREETDIKIHTHVAGCAGSGAALIAMTGDNRTIGENSFMLIHQISSAYDGKHENLEDEYITSVKLMDTLRKICKQKSKMSKKEIDELMDHDWWLSANECLEKGIVDNICKRVKK